jgi:hypothetical protein
VCRNRKKKLNPKIKKKKLPRSGKKRGLKNIRGEAAKKKFNKVVSVLEGG